MWLCLLIVRYQADAARTGPEVDACGDAGSERACAPGDQEGARRQRRSPGLQDPGETVRRTDHPGSAGVAPDQFGLADACPRAEQNDEVHAARSLADRNDDAGIHVRRPSAASEVDALARIMEQLPTRAMHEGEPTSANDVANHLKRAALLLPVR
jgi:hypothetical protein